MIYSWSQFNYGHKVTAGNQTIVFSEGDEKLFAEITPGSYTLGQYAQAVGDAMTAAGTQAYQGEVDRLSGNYIVVTGGVSPFTLHLSDGQFTAKDLMGFTGATDLSGLLTYRANVASGVAYRPQFMVQSYVAADHFKESIDQTVNKAANGRTELVRFGVVRKIQAEIKFISNLIMDGYVIRNNPRGLEDAVEFLDYATSKCPLEFVPDIDNPNVFQKVILDSTPEYKDGTGYRLKELYAENVPDVYETGPLTFQVL